MIRSVSDPVTRYAKTADGIYVAYQVSGSGPRVVLMIMGHGISVEDQWEGRPVRQFIERLGEFARVIRFDRRGTGLSDAVESIGDNSWEQWVEDAIAVFDVIDADQVDVIAVDGNASRLSIMLAATSQRVRRLVLFNPSACTMIGPDYPWGFTNAQFEEGLAETLEERLTGRAQPQSFTALIPSELREWWDTSRRRGLGPTAQVELNRAGGRSDLRAALPSLNTPTLVMLRPNPESNFPGGLEMVRYVAEMIPDTQLVELPAQAGIPYFAFLGDTDTVLATIERFLTGRHAERPADRVLGTVLFTDLVDSTGHAARDGDRRWRDRLDAHDAMVRACLQRHRGREINTTGDGFLAVFDGPARAIGCAQGVIDGGAALGLPIRVGVHTGEIELRGDDIAGIGVNIGARVAALAGDGEILVSRTVVDLVAGSPIRFTDRGEHDLKGIDTPWRLYAVERQPGP